MSKMSAKLEENLDAYKYEMWEACKAVDEYLGESYPWNMPLKARAADLIQQVIDKIEQ